MEEGTTSARGQFPCSNLGEEYSTAVFLNRTDFSIMRILIDESNVVMCIQVTTDDAP